MVVSRVLAAFVLGAVAVAGIAVAPAIGAPGEALLGPRPAAALRTGIGAFTPAAADPRLAAALARAGIGVNGFRFTPSDARRNPGRAVTVAVRARSARGAGQAFVAATDPTLGLTPIAYNLGAAVGWRRFALSGDVTKVDLAGQPGSREAAELGVSYSAGRASARVTASADRPLAGTPRLIAEPEAYSVDLGGSYSLTRNLAVIASVRYKSDRDRLVRLRDDRRDSQAVYVGTAFRF